ncbi:MAG: 16S rRNA (cytosine(967)-C(5))-methyltransferase RsmB, partial [Deltaproteobacteria bacterium]|nr:16S rRNA (cytosine(967)-C(5))-methyltransferase RsmB [Deltaproteobacteria bacterium]
MLYITCTISKEENEDVVADFLKSSRDMKLDNLKDHVPDWGIDLITDQGLYKSLPHIHGTEGFFAALFLKKKS